MLVTDADVFCNTEDCPSHKHFPGTHGLEVIFEMLHEEGWSISANLDFYCDSCQPWCT